MVIKKNYCFFIFYFSVCFIPLFSQEIEFERITTNDGLSQSSVTSIVQDSTGFIWFGTYNGLNRFDGYNYKVFTANKNNPDGLSHSFIRAMVIDGKGRLWIGTMGGGLNLYDNQSETFRHFQNDPQDSTSISNDLIQSLCVDKEGYLWIGTWGGGLNKLDLNGDLTEKPIFERYNNTDVDADENWNRISSIYEDKTGNVWIGSPYGLTKFQTATGQFKIFRKQENNPASLSSNNVSAICEDKNNNLWVATWEDGLNKLNPSTDTFTRYPFNHGKSNGPSYRMIMTLYRDNFGELWVGTWGDGLNRISIKNKKIKFISYNYKHSTSKNNGNFVYSVYKDRSGVLWIGTDWQGINKYDKGKFDFNHYQVESNNPNWLNENAVFPFLKDRYGRIWIGTRNGGINIFNKEKNTFKHYTNNPNNPGSLIHNSVRALYDDSKGSVWIGTEIGLDRYDYKSQKFTHYTINGKNPVIYIIFAICEDNDGDLWIGTYTRGAYKINPAAGKIEHFIHNPNDPNSISGDLIRCIFKDNNGLLWFATDNNGISVYDPVKRKFISYKNIPGDSSSISTNKTITVFEDSKQTMWIGTDLGLNKMLPGQDGKRDKFIHYTVANGLPSNTIQSILEDKKGHLWIATDNGISEFNPENETFKNFEKDDGLQDKEFNSNSAFNDNDTGELYFGGVNGFNVFYPDSIHENMVPPAVVLTDFRLSNKSVPIGKQIGNGFIFNKSITYTNDITLSYKNNVFSLEFAALHFNAPDANQYLYKLENFDKDWNSANYNQRTVTYTNLNPGDYIFHVKASNNDGVWNNTGKSLHILITPPFWQTWWFRIMLFAFVVYILSAGYRYRTKAIQDRNRFLRNEVLLRKKAEKQAMDQNVLLEKAVDEKTHEMEELMEKMIRQEKLVAVGKISSSIAHELRNPLGAVKQSVFFLKAKFPDISDKLTNHLNLIDNELAIADKVIDDLLEMTRIKKLKKEYTDINNLITSALKRCNINSSFKVGVEISPDAQFVWVDQLQLQQVLVNIITNAKQAIEGKGKIQIKTSQTTDKKYFQIDIEDNGIGIKEENLDKIFELLYTSKSKGTGLGLSICKQIMENHDGDIKISSKINKGTKVSLFFPVYINDKS